ncbi:MAG: hypothetical protein J5506_04250 [Prevotella sp.]|nr:hypothetical protein [Prevotella sp.]
MTSSSKEMLLSSGGVTGDNGIDYGGVDDGTHDPAAKEFKSQSIWEEEDNSKNNILWDE